MGIASKETDHAIFDVDGDAIPIAVCCGDGMIGCIGGWSILPMRQRSVMHLSRFDGELMLVIDVLIGTAAASAEIRDTAPRRDGATVP